MNAARTAAALSAAALACTGCSPPPGAGYFPLEKGHRWVYRSSSEWENATVEHETIELRNLGEETIDSGAAYRRRSTSGVDYWLRADSTGIYRVASKNDLLPDPQPDKPVRFVLKMPLAVGTSWSASTTAYLLRRNAEFPPEIRHTHAAVPMAYRIEALGEAVRTPAGEFKDCLRVQGSAVMRLFADPVVGFRDMPLATTEWYCQGVGLVKLERSEPANNSTFLKGGKLVMELTEWQ